MRMRRFETMNVSVENLNQVGDFVVCKISKDGETMNAVIVKYDSYSIEIYQNIYNGSDHRLDLPYDAKGYMNDYFKWGWFIRHSEEESLEECIAQDYWEIEKIYTSVEFSVAFEYESYGTSERPTAPIVDFLLDGYETSTIYRGFDGYHRPSRVLNNPTIKKDYKYRIGIELEVEFANSSSRSAFCDKRSNWFYRESDSSLGSYGCEIVTIPLLPKDAKNPKTWKPLIEELTRLNAKSWDTSGRCGLHCHFSRTMFGKDEEEQMENIVKMCFFYDHFLHDTTLNTEIYGRSSSYHECSGKTKEADAIKTLGVDLLKHKSIKKKVLDASKRAHDYGRYFDINIQNTHTIEFRKGKGSINVDRIVAIVEYNELIAQFCIKSKITELTYERFVEFAKKKISASSPLRFYFKERER